mgnify:CR=1 FL=1
MARSIPKTWMMTDEELIAEGFAEGLPVITFKDQAAFEKALGLVDAIEIQGDIVTDQEIKDSERPVATKPVSRTLPKNKHGKV